MKANMKSGKLKQMKTNAITGYQIIFPKEIYPPPVYQLIYFPHYKLSKVSSLANDSPTQK